MTDYRAERTAGKSGFVVTVDTGGTQPADPDGHPGTGAPDARHWRRRVRGAGGRPDAAAADRTHRDHLHVRRRVVPRGRRDRCALSAAGVGDCGGRLR